MVKTHYKILNKYVKAVKEILPPSIKNDKEELEITLDEIVSHILDLAEEIAGNEYYKEEDIRKALLQFGTPEHIAQDYEELENNLNDIFKQPNNDQLRNSDSLSSDLLNEGMILMQNQNRKQIFRFLSSILVGVYGLEPPQRYLIVGKLISSNPDYFYEKIYKKLQRFLQNSTQFNAFMFEQSIIENYTLLPDEKILASFHGKISLNFHLVRGRVFVTNYRIIINGKVEPTITAFMLFKMPWGEIEAKKELKRIQLGVRNKYPGKFCLGYQYNFIHPSRIKMGYKKIRFQSKFEIEKNYQRTLKNYRVNITVEELNPSIRSQAIESIYNLIYQE